MLTTLLYSLLALDQTVATLATQYCPWLYAIRFVVICSSGIFVSNDEPASRILWTVSLLRSCRGVRRIV